MKLHPDYLTYNSNEEYIIVAAGESAEKFCGIAKGNATTGIIIELLKKETTKQEIIEELMNKFEVEYSIVEKDVEMVLCKLKEMGAIVGE